MGIVPNFQFLFSQEASQPLPCILNFSNARISVFPEFKEFLIMLYGFPSSALNLKILPLVFDSLHKLLEARLSADVFEDFVVGEIFHRSFL